MKKTEKSINLGERKLTLSTGHVAQQASGAVMASYGETVVLATVVAQKLKEDRGYFPLFVEYQERLFAGGRIKGSRWVKRGGRPSDDEILTARLVDRSIRPLFPEEYKKEVQVIITVLSVDLENSPDIPAAAAVSAALSISNIPWKGPIAMIKVGMKEDDYFTNPTKGQLEESKMELLVSATKDAIVMIEAGSKQVSEEQILGGVKYAKKETEKVIKLIDTLVSEVGEKKEVIQKKKTNISLERKVKELSKDKTKKLIVDLTVKKVGYEEYDEIKQAVIEALGEEEKAEVGKLFDELFAKELRKMILSGKRPDGRKPNQIRELSAEIGILPRTHGSAIFKRGQTQVLSVTTLGASSLEQIIESAEGEETKRYIHHYSMPPYSVGETGRVGWPSRREIGHGALAERALEPVIPPKDEFPYTIMVVSEILSSNGSTSMASTCGSSLSLMDAGVPISAPVAGISMGLVVESAKKYAILTDITGLEDGHGDMDFKVAGTAEGITALQLDVKTLNLSLAILEEALGKAKEARVKILEGMKKAITKPRSQLSNYAPKIKVVKIPQDKIGEIIGPGGKMIRAIIAETGAQVDVDDEGRVSISAMSDEEVEKAVAKVEGLVKEVAPGEIYEGEVKRIQPFGAFIEILPGKEGMVHVSDMKEDFVSDPSEVVKVGEKVKVRVKEIDGLGRINLSMLLEGDKKKDTRYQKPRDSYRPRQRFGRQDQRQPRQKRSSGPHFPASRLLDSSRKKGFSR